MQDYALLVEDIYHRLMGNGLLPPAEPFAAILAAYVCAHFQHPVSPGQ